MLNHFSNNERHIIRCVFHCLPVSKQEQKIRSVFDLNESLELRLKLYCILALKEKKMPSLKDFLQWFLLDNLLLPDRGRKHRNVAIRLIPVKD